MVADVCFICCRSNIYVNGKPKDDTFEHLTGYVEQNDLHNGQATVREALEFSAYLRLPASVDEHTRATFVDEVMALVGLTSIQNRMIGDVSQPSLSSGQLKLLTIAVELVANPSIIFLDEPVRSESRLAESCCCRPHLQLQTDRCVACYKLDQWLMSYLSLCCT